MGHAIGMPKQIEYHLNKRDEESVQAAMKHDKRPEVRQRATAVHMLHKGLKPAEVAEQLAVSAASIYNWHKRWRRDGMEGLANQPTPGRPAKATEEYVAILAEVIEQAPQEHGYAFTVWTVARLVEHMVQVTGIRLSPTQFRVLLQKHDYVYRRPKHDLSELQDDEAREQADEWLTRQKKEHSLAKSSSSLWTKAPSASCPSCASAG